MRAIESAERLYYDLDIAEKCADDTRALCEKASKGLLKKLKKAYPKHRIDTGISKVEADYLLSNNDDHIDIMNVKNRLEGLSQSKLKASTTTWANDTQTKSRANKLNDLVLWEVLMPLYWEIHEEVLTALEKVRRNQYLYSKYDIQRTIGKASIVNDIPYPKYDEGWGLWTTKLAYNTEKLEKMTRNELYEAFLLGRSLDDVEDLLDHRFSIAANEARRLVRTESTYEACQAQLNAYLDSGIDYYEYVAILDMRTSEMCKRMNGSVHRVENAVVGINLPPLHPWCRSTTIAHIPPEEIGNPFWAGEIIPNEIDYLSWEEEWVEI